MPPRRRRVRGHIEQLPTGTFRVHRLRGHRPLTGEPRRLRETSPTYDEAEQALTQLQRQVDDIARRHPACSYA
jgi:hypothetical protein